MNDQEKPLLRFDILSLFPEVFGPFLQTSIPGIAQEKGLAEYHRHDIRDYSADKHAKVDAPPYGGGPGMVIQCEPVFRCWEAVRDLAEPEGRLLLLTPVGEQFDQRMAHGLSQSRRVTLLCGRYEGFDERIHRGLPAEEVSIGDYVLSGGEAAAMVVVDAVTRLLPGVLGHEQSTRRDSFAEGLLEHPHYTRPAEFRGMKVPDVLLSGHHGKIARWRREQAEKRTRNRRADLLEPENARTEKTDG